MIRNESYEELGKKVQDGLWKLGGLRDLAKSVGCGKDLLYKLRMGEASLIEQRFGTVVRICDELEINVKRYL